MSHPAKVTQQYPVSLLPQGDTHQIYPHHHHNLLLVCRTQGMQNELPVDIPQLQRRLIYSQVLLPKIVSAASVFEG